MATHAKRDMRMRETEKDIEAYLIAQVSKRDGLCWKFTSPGRRGVPDRWCAVCGFQFFAELKGPRHKARSDEKLQKAIHEKMARRNVKTYVLETKQDIDLLMRYLDNSILPEVRYFARL